MGQTVRLDNTQSFDEKDGPHLVTGARGTRSSPPLPTRGKRLSGHMESLDTPAAILAQDYTILLANSRFRKRVSREVVGLTVGEVMNCSYSALLGRCGETVACLLCTLKKSVDHTWLTGEGLRGIQMSYPHKAAARRTSIITTVKVGDGVLLLLGTPSKRSANCPKVLSEQL
jgi:hypothetical protein